MGYLSEINAKIQGRIALLSEEEAVVLVKMVSIPGDHVELGTLWGGTAILAALAKKRANVPGDVFTVDFMKGGYWENGDPSLPSLAKPTEKAVYDNLAAFGVSNRVTVVKAASHPWPLGSDVHPSTVLIDCGHSYEAAKQDWENVRALNPQFIAFHDVNPKTHPGVYQVVEEILANDRDYLFAAKAGTMVVMSRKQEPEPIQKPKARKGKRNV